MDKIRKNEIIAVVLFTISLFLFLSIFTFSEQDLSFYTSNPNSVPQNATGVLGAYIGGLLLFLSGKAAYVLPLLILIWGLSRLFQVEPRKFYFKVFGTVVLVTAVSASLSITANANDTLAFARGGIIGTISAAFLLEYLGQAGAMVFIAALIVLSLLIATEFLILPMLAAAFRFVVSVPGRVSSGMPRRRVLDDPDKREERGRKKSAKEDIAKKLEQMKKQVEEVRRTSLAAKQAGARVKAEEDGSVRKGPSIVASKKTEKAAPKKEKQAVPSPSDNGDYELPSLDLLKAPSTSNVKEREEVLKGKALLLEKTLLEFGVEAKVVKINRGPVITMYELEPALGTKVNRITSLGDNISLALKSTDIRIVAPLPGKGTIGIEVPNEKSELVLLRDILESVEYNDEDSSLKIALGKDLSGTPIITDLAKMPHLLIAGATGSGKTVCINCIISSMLFNCGPEELKFLMIDPKRVELMIFEGIPHLVSPIVTNPKKAAAALNWVVAEMERRYELFAQKGVRNISIYRDRMDDDDEYLPYIVVIVDELADLIMVGQQEVEGAIMRIAQLSRAAGIHMILATQRPSVNVITGVIKANFPARISFKVASKVDSRTVLDTNGAEKLLGRGDMLVMQPGESSITRGQCSLVEDSEIRRMMKHIKAQGDPQYIDEVVAKQESKISGTDQEKDDLYEEAVRIVIGTQQASVSMIQRKLRVGYTRAARMIDIMEEEGIVGPYNGSKPREILITDPDIISDDE